LVVVGYAVLVGSPSFGFHLLGPAAIGSIIALSLVVLVDLSYPFSGDFRHRSGLFQVRCPGTVLPQRRPAI